MTDGEMETTGGFKRFKDRMGTIEEIETGKLTVSEFNTRSEIGKYEKMDPANPMVIMSGHAKHNGALLKNIHGQNGVVVGCAIQEHA